MYIKRLELENYRGFRNLVIDFPAEANNLNVFVGINGSGKSSILDALSLALEGFIYTLYSSKNRNSEVFFQNVRPRNYFDIHPDDIRINSDYLLVKADLGDSHQTISWSVSYEKYFQQLSLFKVAGVDSHSDSKFSLGISFKNSNSVNFFDIEESYPVVAYYRILRTNIDSYLNRSESTISHGKRYPNSFSISFQDLDSLADWFKSEEDIENTERLTRNIPPRLSGSQIFKIALDIFSQKIGDNLFQEVKALRFQESLWHPKTLLTFQKGSSRLKAQQLSDGEKMLLLLVSGIALRMAVFNPGAHSPEEALLGKGIILIDEIDSHLHPSWQRAVLPALTATFPNCQFIVTTHSPQVISSVPSESIFVLDGGSVIYNPGYTHGRDANSILRELMDVSDRMPKIQEKIDECFRLVDDENLEEAKLKLKALNEILGNNDPDIIHLKTMIDFLEENPSYPELTS